MTGCLFKQGTIGVLKWVLSVSFVLVTACSNKTQFSAAAVGNSNLASSSPMSVGATGSSIYDVHNIYQAQGSTISASKVDIVLIIDDSKSMLDDNRKLASKLSKFIDGLQSSNLDWQACITNTGGQLNSDGSRSWGDSFYWQNSLFYTESLGMVLKKGQQSDLSGVFINTINYIGAEGSGDERGIKAAYNHVLKGDLRYGNSNGCYRADAAAAYIIISDEDERSIGGDYALLETGSIYKPIETEDMPTYFTSVVKSTFGADKKFTVNSIIVRSGDSTCMAAQDIEAKSQYGTFYAELSRLTAGGVGSICDSDYSSNLNLFIDKIKTSIASSFPVDCAPTGDISVKVTPAVSGLSYSMQGLNVLFNKEIPGGHTVEFNYKCKKN